MHTKGVDDIYELSPLQRGLLLHSVHDGASDMYLSQQTYIFRGKLEPGVLVEAWNAATDRHPAMRTSFHWNDLDTPLQVVHQNAPVTVRNHDWTTLPEQQHSVQIDELLLKDRAIGFDLSRPPLQRLNIAKLAPDRYCLIWTYHHLLLDGWSIPIFTHEVLMQYKRISLGTPVGSEPPPYSDYIAWLQQQDAASTKRFWTDTLSGIIPSHLAALERWDPRHSTGAVDRRTVPQPTELQTELRSTASGYQVTLNTLIQAAWSTVLSHFSDTRDITYGCVTSGRPPELPDVDQMVGMFANTLPMYTTLRPAQPVAAWLEELQSHHARMRRCEYTPLADIKKWAGSPGRPLFETNLSVENFTSAFAESNGSGGFERASLYDKTNDPIAVTVTPEPLTIDMVIHRERFPEGFIDTLVRCFATALDAITTATTVDEILSDIEQAAAQDSPTPPGTPSASDSPAPAVIDLPPGRDHSAPVDPELEAQVLRAFREVLEDDTVDYDTSFFELGGDSFDAVRVVSRLDNADLGMLAAFPTARELAAALGDPTVGSQIHTTPAITATERGKPLPCTFQQEGVWYMHKNDPATTVLHVPTALLVRGELDLTALQNALRALVARHEALRTRFVAIDGVPHQIIDEPDKTPDIEIADIKRSEIEGWVADRHIEPFDLAHEGVLRMSVARVTAQTHVVMLAVHHIAVDGWSSKILADELSALYTAETTGTQAALPPLPIQPADYAAWQRTDNLESVHQHVQWWRQKLDDFRTLDLPTDFTRPANPTGAGRIIDGQLSKEATTTLKEYARINRVSVLSILHAALLTVLERHTNQRDIVIGSLFAGRSMPEIEPLVGYFLSTPAIRVDLGHDTPFADLVERCQNSISEANEHLDAPFPLVVDALRPKRIAGRNPVFQVGLTLLPSSVAASLDLGPNIQGKLLGVPDDYALWDLSVDASDASPDGHLHASMEYSTDLFTHERIERLMQEFLHALENGIKTPTTPYSELELTAETDRSSSIDRPGPRREHGHLRRSMSRALTISRDPRSVDDLITSSLLRSPNQPRLISDDIESTSGEIHRAACVIGDRLNQRGVGAGATVATCLPNGPELIAAALATWRLGAALLPLDPLNLTRPILDRLAEYSDLVVITDQNCAEQFDVCLVVEWDELNNAYRPIQVTPGNAAVDAPALITIDAAGQTSTATHRLLADHLRALQLHCPLRSRDVMLWHRPPTSWSWVRQVLWPLVAGSSSFIEEPSAIAVHRDEENPRKITALDCTPYELPSMLTSVAPAEAKGLRLVLCDGLPKAASLARLDTDFPRVQLHLPVDAPQTGFAGCAERHRAPSRKSAPPPTFALQPIGRNTVHVTDSHGRTPPVGVTGRIYFLGGGREGPVDTDYLGRRDSDGSITFVGTRASRGSSFGHSYQLETITDTISLIDGVSDVLLRLNDKDRPDAYITLAEDADPQAVTARIHTTLPVHLRPLTVQIIPAMPLTTRGEIDLGRLPAPTELARPAAVDVQHTVATAVAQLLDAPIPDFTDNLFDYGMSSLKITQLSAKLDADLSVTLTPHDILSSPSIAELTEIIAARQEHVAFR